MADPKIENADSDDHKSDSGKEQDSESPEVSSGDLDVKDWLKPDTPPEIVERFAKMSLSYSGPMPPSFEARRYEELSPGATNRFISMAEKGLDLQEKSIDGNIGLARRRINASTIVSLSMLAIAALAIVLDPAWLSIPLGLAGTLNLLIREFIKIGKGKTK